MEAGYYDELTEALHDLADEIETLNRDEITRRLRELAGPDTRPPVLQAAGRLADTIEKGELA